MTDKYPATRIIILNYNGEELLPECLPSIMEALREAPFAKVTILDNLSEDGGLELIQKQFPEVTLEIAPENRILCSYNDYLPKISEPVVILLNNDIRVEPDFIKPLIRKFQEDPKTFLVAPRVMNFDGSAFEAARTKARLRFGILECSARYPGYQKEAFQPSETYASGFGAFSRDKFLALKGYDDRYLPGIMEDVDICYRAQRAGYRLYYEPKSVVYHIGQASFKKRFGAFQIAKIAHRNTFWFMWKNFRGLSFWAQHIFYLPFRLTAACIRGNWAMIAGFFEALAYRKR